VLDESDLRVELRVLGDDDEVVYGVEAEADGVELSGGRGLEGESQACSSDSDYKHKAGGGLNAPNRHGRRACKGLRRGGALG
jgi:hypothetical protein